MKKLFALVLLMSFGGAFASSLDGIAPGAEGEANQSSSAGNEQQDENSGK